jgi:hypothetical protein
VLGNGRGPATQSAFATLRTRQKRVIPGDLAINCTPLPGHCLQGTDDFQLSPAAVDHKGIALR